MRKLTTLIFALFLLTGYSWGQNAPGKLNMAHPSVISQLKKNNGIVPSQQQPVSGIQNVTLPTPDAPLGTSSPYYFTQTSGTYTAISGGTSIGATTDDEQVYNNIDIGFTFTWSGSTYTKFSVATNGFLAMGATVVTSNTPISTGTTNNVFSPLGANLAGQTGSELQYKVLGTSPARTLVVQWTAYRKSAATGDNFNFQVRLNESDNSIQFVYGAFTVNNTNSTVQVGLRAASSSDYANRIVDANYTWATSYDGISNASNCRLRTATKPATGQTYTWTPYAPYTVPFTQNFDLLTTSALPIHWSMSNNNSDLYQWQIFNYTGANSLPNAMGIHYCSSTSTASNDWAYLPALSLSGGHTYKIEFYYAGYDATAIEKLEVKWGASPSAAGMTSAAIFTNASITNTAFVLGSGTFTPSTSGNYYIGFHAYSTYADGWYLFVDDVNVFEQVTNDVASVTLLNPTQIPATQQLPWFGKVKNNGTATQTFGVDTKLRENTFLSTTSTNTVTALTTGSVSTLSGNFDLSALGAGSTFDLSMQTMLTGDQVPANDLYTNYTHACTKTTSYAWDDGVSDGSVGFNTGSGWLGQLYYFSSPATLYSCQVMWGTITGLLPGTSLEIYNVAAGVPTTKFADIATGINLSPSDQDIWKSYDAASAVSLPAGTYWIGVHQSDSLSGTFIMGNDQTGFTATTFLPGHCFYKATGSTWSDYTGSALYMFNMIRPGFSYVACVNPSNFSATATSTSDVNLAWNLNLSGNNVLVAWSVDGVFGTPTDGHVYGSNEAISGGGTVLQYNNSTTYLHQFLTPGQVYYYKIWSYNGVNYSSGVTTNCTPPCDPTVAPITENFESGTFPPYCWPALNGSLWADNTDASGFGVGLHSALAEFYNIQSTTPFDLITLPFDASSMPSPTLSFDYAHATYSGEADDMKIYTSTNNGATWTLLLDMTSTMLLTGGTITTYFIPTATQWATKTLAIGSTVNKIKFTATSAYGNNLYIDNVKIYQVYAHDIGISALDPQQCFPLGTASPKATVTNYGTNAETSFTVTMTIGAYTSTKTVASLAANTSTVVTFDPWTNSTGNFTMEACTQLAADENIYNNCMSQDVKVMILNKLVYGYTTFSTTDNGPISFNLNNPGVITEIVNDYPVTTYPAGGSWANGSWYATIYASTTPYNLVTINTASGARTIIGNMGVNINAMSYNKANNTMYGAGYDGTNSKLYTISLSTGAATLVGTIGPRLIINMAINNAGVCYATDIDHDVLGTIDLTSGSFTTIGSIGFNAAYAQDMEFDRESGELFMAAYGSTGQLRWVNTTTGSTMLIGNFQGGVEVTGFAIPYADAVPLTITGVATPATCNGGSNGSITTTVSGGTSPFTYLWSNGAITASLAGISAGTYSVTVTDATSVSATGSWTVTQPTAISATATVTASSCYQSADGSISVVASGGTPSYTYSWNTGATTASITGLTAGTYSVTVSDSHQCTYSNSWTVTQPLQIQISGTVNNVTCSGACNGSVYPQITNGVAPFTYSWKGPYGFVSSSTSISNLCPGNYTLTIVDANNCSVEHVFIVNEPAAIQTSATVTNASCSSSADGAITLSVSGGTTPYTYLWSNAATSASISGLTVGSYTVTVTDVNNCQKISTCQVGMIDPVCNNYTVTGTISNMACFNAYQTLTVVNVAITSTGYVDFISGQKILIEPGTVVQYGGYMHAYISSTFCTATKSGEFSSGEGALPAANDHSGFMLYPNPTNGNFTLMQKGDNVSGTLTVEIFSMSGEKVMTRKMSGQKSEFETSALSNGLYFVKIIAGDHVETIKLVKTR